MTVTINGTTGLAGVDGSAGTPAIQGGDTNTGMFFPAADTIAFAEGGAEVARFDSSGNLGIGTTPLEKCHIYASSGNSFYKFQNAATGSGASDGGFVGIGSSGDVFLYNYEASNTVFATNNAERMRIDSSGNLILAGSTAQKATGTTWSNPSDQRLKDNIRDYAKGTAELMQVRVREWEYNGKGGTTEGVKGLGVVADEVMTVLPNTVENYDAKLNADDKETTAIKKFDATEITWLLVKTVQEQQALITGQQAMLASLTARIEALEQA